MMPAASFGRPAAFFARMSPPIEKIGTVKRET
jgi:hypothetical protein